MASPPFVRLRYCEGRTYSAAREFLEEVESLAKTVIAVRPTRMTSEPPPTENSVRPLKVFHRDSRYGSDLHPADMAWALHAACRGLSEQQIREQIIGARDLSKKGEPARQLDYAERTARKAVHAVQPLR